MMSLLALGIIVGMVRLIVVIRADRYAPQTAQEIAEAGVDYLERSDTSYAHHNTRLRDHARN